MLLIHKETTDLLNRVTEGTRSGMPEVAVDK